MSWRSHSPIVLSSILLCSAFCASAGSSPPASQITVERSIQLTDDKGYYMAPVWSPDGEMIAFTRPKFIGIEIMNRDGTGRKVLTRDPGAGYRFAWSPDSREIAYRATETPDGERLDVIRSVNVETGKIRDLSQPARDLHPPKWSMSGNRMRVSYVAGKAPVHAGWEKLHRSLPASVAQAGSRRAGKLLFHEGENIWITNEDGTEMRQLTDELSYHPVLSPDGSRIVYSRGDTLMVMNADGSDKRELCAGHHPAWSPDGTVIVFQVDRDDGHRIVSSNLYLINADGTGRSQLTKTAAETEVEPSWSPDGKTIVCRDDKNGQIYLITLKW